MKRIFLFISIFLPFRVSNPTRVFGAPSGFSSSGRPMKGIGCRDLRVGTIHDVISATCLSLGIARVNMTNDRV